MTVLKYLTQHLSVFILSLLFPMISFYSFYFNTIFVCFMILFMAYNTSRNNLLNVEKAIKLDIENNISNRDIQAS